LAAVLLVGSLFVANLADHLVAESLCCADDAFLATAAKNLAQGRGYASSYDPRKTGEVLLLPFDPLISTGPALILPAAAAIRVFGPRYWVPGAVVVAVNLLLLGALLVRLRSGAGDPRRWAAAAILLVVALNLAMIGHYEQWYALLGEIPALLLIGLGIALIFAPSAGPRAPLGGAFLLGLAYQTKSLAALSLPVVAAFVLLRAVRGGRRDLRTAALAIALLCLPTAAFETYKLASLGLDEYRDVKQAEAVNMQVSKGSGFGVLTSEHPFEQIGATASGNWQRLAAYFTSPWAAAACLLSLGVGLAARRRWREPESWAALVLGAVAASYTVWWLMLSAGGRIRYLFLGLGLWCLAVVFDLATGTWSYRKAALALLVAAALLPRLSHSGRIAPPRPFFQPSARTAAMLETARFLETHRQERRIAADWWASGADMEYLLDGSSSLVHHLWLDELGSPSVLFRVHRKWLKLTPGLEERFRKTIDRSQGTLVFERGPYQIFAAPPLDSVKVPR
jgi:hypothetical protein